jgi:hypothetical protein
LCAIPNREGWGENYRSAENLGKLHYYRPSNGAGLTSLCGRRFEVNESSAVLGDVDETRDGLCGHCLTLLHREVIGPAVTICRLRKCEIRRTNSKPTLLSHLGSKMGLLWNEGAASFVYRACGSATLSGLALRSVVGLQLL